MVDVINSIFQNEDLKIIQKDNMLKYSLDSVLLANFVTINKKTKNILDIGTGNAPIPLLISKRTEANITAVEIQEESYGLAKKSIKMNNLDNKIKLYNMDVFDFSKDSETDVYDVIVCNPPYFKMNENSKLNDSELKTIARHEKTLDIRAIFKISKKLLKNNGYVSIVHRPERLIDIIEAMKLNNIEPKRILFIHPYEGKEANIMLIEGAKNGKPGVKILDSIYANDRFGKYTNEIKNYCKIIK